MLSFKSGFVPCEKKKKKKKKPDRAQIVTELCKIWEKNTLAQVKTTKLSLIVLTQGILKPIPSQHNGYSCLANKHQFTLALDRSVLKTGN